MAQTLFSNTCGRCNEGKIFKGLLTMNAKCPHCQYQFENEQGHFIGAMIISYFLTAFLALPSLLILVFKYEVHSKEIMALVSLQIVITGPLLYRFSKLAWIHMEERFVNQMRKNEEKH